MKIVVVADTHLPKRSKGLPEQLKEELSTAEQIIHAGDWQTIEVYEEFKKYGEVIGVSGNADDEVIRELLPTKRIVSCMGYKIGIVHGDGKGKTTEKRALETFQDDEVDIIIFGHSHIPYIRYVNGVLLFNPGSATDKRKLPVYSFGTMTIDEMGFSTKHVYVK